MKINNFRGDLTGVSAKKEALICSGRKKEVIDDEKEEMFKAQQEVLRARREGRSLAGVNERREKARQEV